MSLIDSKKTFFLINSAKKYTLILKNNLSQIILTLTIHIMHRPTISLVATYWLPCKIKPV